MSHVRALATVLGPILVLGTMGVGLRLGAEQAGTAALVIAAPPPASHDRLAWQLRVLHEERRIRDAAPGVPLEVHARFGDREATWSGVSNDEGVAEADLPLAGVRTGDAVQLEVRGQGVVLARGDVRVPPPGGSRVPDPLRPTKVEGPLALSVFAPPGGVAPQFPNAAWVRVRDAAGRALAGAKITAEGDPGLDALRTPSPTCAAGLTRVDVQAMGHVLGLKLTATAENATGTWYGALPVVPGGDQVWIEPAAPAPGAAFTVRVRSATQKPLVYVELLDDEGRALAGSAPVARAPSGFGEASLAVPRGLPAGRHFAVVSSRADGFALGTAVAQAFRVGGAAGEQSCEGDFELAVREPPTFDHAPALDGFLLRREEAARTRRKGMTLAVGALVTGAIMAALMLFGSLRRSTPHVDPELPEAAAITQSTTPRWLVVAILVGLSCLAYFLLTAMVLYSGN